MSELTPIYALSIAGRLTLEMHSLNNEGGEGNQIQTRMVTLVDSSGDVHTVNAVSGDMFKHIHAEHLQRLSKSRGLPLCSACNTLNASRITDDPAFVAKMLEQKTVKAGKKNKRSFLLNDSQVIDLLLQTCVLDDAEGNLIAPSRSGSEQKDESSDDQGEQGRERQPGRSIPRKSVAEFGWVVGLPGTKTESYFHVRYASERGGEEGVTQPIFHRPASSGIYAIVSSFEIARLGYNDISQTYPVDEDTRLARHKALLESTMYTFIEPAGAMRSTQNPHIYDFSGVITISQDVLPAPLLSPLNDSYADEISRVAQAMDGNGALQVHRFNSMGEFAEIMRRLIDTTRPYRLFTNTL
jgi:CRISPR-associated protein Cst2